MIQSTFSFNISAPFWGLRAMRKSTLSFAVSRLDQSEILVSLSSSGITSSIRRMVLKFDIRNRNKKKSCNQLPWILELCWHGWHYIIDELQICFSISCLFVKDRHICFFEFHQQFLTFAQYILLLKYCFSQKITSLKV